MIFAWLKIFHTISRHNRRTQNIAHPTLKMAERKNSPSPVWYVINAYFIQTSQSIDAVILSKSPIQRALYNKYGFDKNCNISLAYKYLVSCHGSCAVGSISAGVAGSRGHILQHQSRLNRGGVTKSHHNSGVYNPTVGYSFVRTFHLSQLTTFEQSSVWCERQNVWSLVTRRWIHPVAWV